MADTAADAAARAGEMGFPVVLKIQSPEVVHKTEVGGVVLGLDSADRVEQAGAELLAKGPAGSKLLVQEMVSGTEVILGARVDPQYGPFVMVGLGGIFVEVLKDVALRLLPVTTEDAHAMLRELKGYKILEGVRGQKPRDVDALVRAITGMFGSVRRASRPSERPGGQSVDRQGGGRWSGGCGRENRQKPVVPRSEALATALPGHHFIFDLEAVEDCPPAPAQRCIRRGR